MVEGTSCYYCSGRLHEDSVIREFPGTDGSKRKLFFCELQCASDYWWQGEKGRHIKKEEPNVVY
jgi:hypothetical protein